jgi:fructoselysine-6-P-deglycase FrlB-like protein
MPKRPFRRLGPSAGHASPSCELGQYALPMPFDELRAQLDSCITQLRQHIEDQADPDQAYAEATQLREQLQAASDEAATLRAITVRRIQEAGNLSVAAVGQRIGLTKARAQDMLEKAARNQQSGTATTRT